MSNYLLCSKKGKEVLIDPEINTMEKTIRYRICKNVNEVDVERAKCGTKDGRANFRCSFSNATITSNYIKKVGREGKMGKVLIAIIAEGKSGREYFEPNEHHAQVELPDSLVSDIDDCRNTFLSGKVPERLSGGTCYPYGLDSWGKLFTDRQLISLNTFSSLIHEARDMILKDAVDAGLPADGQSLECGGIGATAYAEAVSVYLAFIVDKCADYWSSLCTWHTSGEKMRNTFGRQAIQMSWDFAECNPFCDSTGSWTAMRTWVWKAVERFVPNAIGEENQIDAQSVQYPQKSAIVTDPPYYDNICYADLSDYFYPWMKRNIGNIYSKSGIFEVISTPKREELIAARYRHENANEAEEFFLQGMRDVVKNMAIQLSSEYPIAIFYAFKQSEVKKEGTSSRGWATFLQAVVDAGYAIVGTWPMRTEMKSRMIALRKNALATSVVLVCRKRDRDADSITKADFIQALRREIPLAITQFKAANILPADLPQSAIGPGIGIFSRSKSVLESNDKRMSVSTALQYIYSVCDEYLEGVKGEFDTHTRFAIRWFTEYGMSEGDYGAADNFARALGISVDDVRRVGIIENSAGLVRLLEPEEIQGDHTSSNELGEVDWECLRHLVRLHKEQGLSDDTIKAFRSFESRIGSIKELTYLLYHIAVNKRQNASEGNIYNALSADWEELSDLASQHTQELNFEEEEKQDG